MKKWMAVVVVGSALLAASHAPAAPPVSLTPLGTLKTGAFRAEDPRIAEINAFDAAGPRIYVVNPMAGRLDKALLIVSNEASSTTTLWEIR